MLLYEWHDLREQVRSKQSLKLCFIIMFIAELQQGKKCYHHYKASAIFHGVGDVLLTKISMLIVKVISVDRASRRRFWLKAEAGLQP